MIKDIEFSKGEERFEFLWDKNEDDEWGYNIYHVFPDGSYKLISECEEHMKDCMSTIAWYDAEVYPGAWDIYQKQQARYEEWVKSQKAPETAQGLTDELAARRKATAASDDEW